MEIRPVETELFHADGRTDGRIGRDTETAKLIVTFHNFANPPKKEQKPKGFQYTDRRWNHSVYHKECLTDC